MSPNSSVPLINLLTLFGGLLVFGSIACLPLYQFKVQLLAKSALMIKILFWIPIFIIFVTALYLTNQQRLVLLALLLIPVFREARRVIAEREHRTLIVVYTLFFAAAFLHF